MLIKSVEEDATAVVLKGRLVKKSLDDLWEVLWTNKVI